ncbi:MAG: PQQ-binding-like beta-propeller repeat protein [Pirellulaceae bacterium]|nr:PQQ-binding-like beta-propeller repeat protein [Pirellulaceae bacterium]
MTNDKRKTGRVGSTRRSGCVLLVAIILCTQSNTFAQNSAPVNSTSLEFASHMVRSSGASGGFCVVVGCTDADLALALAKQGAFQVHCLCTSEDSCNDVRKEIRSRGMYGTVSAGTFQGGRLPYTDNLINIVVVDGYPDLLKNGFSTDEVLRVLAPLGTAYIGTSNDDTSSDWVGELTTQLRSSGIDDVSVDQTGGRWVCVKKPWPSDIDEWTHYLHGADGNPVAQDRVVAPPERYQWICGPMWLRSHETDSSLSTIVTSRGRLFYIADEAPISLAGDHPLPDKWFLVARDAFNGVLLWKVPIRRWGWREWKHSWFSCRPGDFPLDIRKRIVAVGDSVYTTLGYSAPVSELDAKSGAILQTYAGTEHAGEILYIDGKLVLPLLRDDQIRMIAVDAASGEKMWENEKAYRGSTVDYVRWRSAYGNVKPPKTNPAANAATDGNVIALIDGPEIVCLDFHTGAEKWRASFPTEDADLTAGGIQSNGNLWNGTMIVSDGVVVHASPNKLAAFSAETGKMLWSQPKKYIGHLWYEWKDVFVIDGLVWTWSAELDEGFFNIGRARKQRELWPRTVNGYDIQTGDLRKEVPLGPIFKTHHHHRCYRNKATSRFILASRRGTEFVDLHEGNHTVHNWVRGTCHVGMMPANGLQYVPPHPCQCYIDEKLSGFTALAAAEGEEKGSGVGVQVSGKRLNKGPAYGDVSPTPDTRHPTPSSWPAFRHDSMRTGSVDTEVPDEAAPLWRATIGSRVSPPIIVADRIFASLVDEHHVVCLDRRDGSKLWEFAAGGRIDSPPTYFRGTVVFGSADGWVYSLRAADGQLAWRFRAAPAERLIGAFGQFESAWPVHGSVLVQNGIAYFAAGRSSQLDGGIWLYGVDAATGELRYETKLEGPDYAIDSSGQKLVREEATSSSGEGEDTFDVNFKLPMGSLPDILMGDGANIYMRSVAFDAELNRARGKPPLETGSGFVEDSYFKRTPWTFGGEYARLIVHDNRSVYYVRMFDTLRGLDPTVFFTPANKGYLLFAKNVDGKRSAWTERIPVRIRAMVLAGGRLFVAGPPDVVDPQDPLGAFEGRKGGLLCVVDSASGERLAEHELPSPPVFNGAAAADGRLYIVDEAGSITCFGEQ